MPRVYDIKLVFTYNIGIISGVPIRGDTMFFRTKVSGPRTYLQIAENRREGGKVKQRVVATLGRLDQLQGSGQLDSLLRSGARFSDAILLLSAHQHGELPVINTQRIGPALIFARLWRETGCQAVLQCLL